MVQNVGTTTSKHVTSPLNTQPTYAPFLFPQPWQEVYHKSTGENIYTEKPIQKDTYEKYPEGTGKCSIKSKKAQNLPQYLGWEQLPQEELTLVSHGEPREDCGEIRAKVTCTTTGGLASYIPQSCKRAVCPICYTRWIERETRAATEKFLAGLQLLKRQNTKNRANHVIISCPPGDYGLTRKQLQTKMLYRAKKLGVIASAIIFHPFRFRNKHTKEPVTWRHCSLNRNAETPIVQSEAYYSPHWHLAAVGYLMASKTFYKKYGWYYRKINNRNLDNEDQVRRMIYYALSHTAVSNQKHSISWGQKFGARHMIIDTKIEHIETPRCSRPNCECGNQSDMTITFIKTNGEYDGLSQLYQVTWTETKYKFREPDKPKHPS